MNHTCKPKLRPDATRSVDGQKYRCACGRAWEYVQDDGALGNYWVPYVPNIHDKHARAVARRKMRKEAQRVWAER